MTQVGVAGAGALVGAGRSIGRRVAGESVAVAGGGPPLAAMQLWPTFRLARLADAHRDFSTLRVRRDSASPGQLRGPRAVPRLAALAALRLGPVPYLARGASRPTSGWSRCSWPWVRSFEVPRASRECGRWRSWRWSDAGAQPRAVRAGLRVLDPACRLLVLPGAGPLGPGDEPGLACSRDEGSTAWPTGPGRRSAAAVSRRQRRGVLPSWSARIRAGDAPPGNHRAAGSPELEHASSVLPRVGAARIDARFRPWIGEAPAVISTSGRGRPGHRRQGSRPSPGLTLAAQADLDLCAESWARRPPCSSAPARLAPSASRPPACRRPCSS